MSPICFGLKNEFGFLILQEAEGNEEEEPAGKDEVDEEETERLEIEKKSTFFSERSLLGSPMTVYRDLLKTALMQSSLFSTHVSSPPCSTNTPTARSDCSSCSSISSAIILELKCISNLTLV